MKTPRAKKPHPAIEAAEAQMIDAIRNADYFMASLFKGAGEYEKVGAPTVAGALAAAEFMQMQARGTQRAMIYAIAPDKRATFLTPALIERLKAQAKGKTNV